MGPRSDQPRRRSFPHPVSPVPTAWRLIGTWVPAAVTASSQPANTNPVVRRLRGARAAHSQAQRERAGERGQQAGDAQGRRVRSCSSGGRHTAWVVARLRTRTTTTAAPSSTTAPPSTSTSTGTPPRPLVGVARRNTRAYCPTEGREAT